MHVQRLRLSEKMNIPVIRLHIYLLPFFNRYNHYQFSRLLPLAMTVVLKKKS